MPLPITRGALSARGFGLFSAPAALVTDPYFPYVTMLLHGDGTNGAQNNTFLDSSTNNFSITRNGNTTQGSFSPYGSNWSNYFDGTGDYLQTSSGFTLGTGDFTVEAWVFGTTANQKPEVWINGGQVGQFVVSTNFNAADAGVILGALSPAGSGWSVGLTGSTALTTNSWNHVAWVRSSGVITVYLNGVANGTYSNSSNSISLGRIGAFDSANYDLNGYISNLRAVAGTAVYTSAFTPPTAPLTAIANTSLLTCQSNRFIDNSTNAFTITRNGDTSVQRFSPFSPSAAYSTSVIGGSGYFDGSTDWLSVADGSWITLGTNNFTAECWIYNTSSTGAGQYICGQGATAASSVSFELYLTSSRTLQGGIYVGSQKYATSTGTIPLNAWTHVALVRDGGNIRIYINGVQDGVNATAGSSSVVDQPYQFSIGRGGEYNASYFVGNISDYRFINGTCLYPNGTTFTPPSAPLTAVSNTQLLCNMTNGAIFDNAMMNNLETVGNAQISTSVFKFGTGSLAFDGAGDYLSSLNTPNIRIGSGNFTVEFWAYFNSTSGNPYLIMCSNASATAGFQFYLNGVNSRWELYVVGPAQTIQAPSAPSTAQWYHVAIVRNGSTVTIYINGSSAVSATNSSWTDETTSPLYIGSYLGSGGYYLNGYIDDLRITKGYARYTTNFTPPTAAFPNN